MTKLKTQYICHECQATFVQWMGQCTQCKAWNSLHESNVVKHQQTKQYAGNVSALLTLDAIDLDDAPRIKTCMSEYDHVLGGGLVNGSVVLIGGDPGVGKSTLLLQILASLSAKMSVLYITGEESLQQVAMRANRLSLDAPALKLLAENQLEVIIEYAKKHQPKVMVIDSIQTMVSIHASSSAGTVTQLRESTAALVQFAKTHQVCILLAGHVTKDGVLAGPRILEHMVDTVLYFESHTDARYRIIRSVKNRFGAVNEMGLFAMTPIGLKQVTNPSAIFLMSNQTPRPGVITTILWEGSRALLIEVQALVDQSHLPNPRRVGVGLDQQRMVMLIAILNRHGNIPIYDQDIFFNVVGGLKITETAADLAFILAVVSSLKNQTLAKSIVVLGEVGLSGELRPINFGQERLREAAKQGFKYAIVPKANEPKQAIEGLTVYGVITLCECLKLFEDLQKVKALPV